MITINDRKGGAKSEYLELYGLSTDTKPTTGVMNGSSFVEMDTGKLYFFDAAGSEWKEWA